MAVTPPFVSYPRDLLEQRSKIPDGEKVWNQLFGEGFRTRPQDPPPLKPLADWEAALGGYLTSIVARQPWVKRYAWFIPTKEVVLELAKQLGGQHVLDVAAGTGYLTYHLRQNKVARITAVDDFSSHYEEGRYNFGVLKMDAVQAVKAYPHASAILLTWPSYNDSLGYRVLAETNPHQWVYYQGEGYGGCTADDVFHAILDDTDYFVECSELADRLNEHHIQFEGIHDRWHVYRRTERSKGTLQRRIQELIAQLDEDDEEPIRTLSEALALPALAGDEEE